MVAAAETGSRWLRITAVASLVLFIGGPLSANQDLIPAVGGFVAFALGGLLGVVSTVVGLVKGFRHGLRAGQEGVLFGIVPAATLVYLLTGAGDFPRINDVTTDLEDPPTFVQAVTLPANRGRDMSYPDAFVPIVREHYGSLGPLHLAVPPEKAFDRALLIARGVPTWRLTAVDRDRLTFEGVDTTRIFHFRDDFVVRARASGGGSRVDMRSKSRDGRGDLGANAARIRTFLAKLRASS